MRSELWEKGSVVSQVSPPRRTGPGANGSMPRKGAPANELCLLLACGLDHCGGLAAVLLKNTVHCALSLTVAFAGLRCSIWSLTRSSRVCADSGLHWRSRHPGCLCDSAHQRVGDAKGRGL